MHLLRLVLTAAFTVVAVSRGISANANEITRTTTAKSTLIHDAVPSLQVATRELSDEDAALEERRGGGGGGGGHGGGGGGGGHGGGGGGGGGHGGGGGGGGGGHGVAGGGGHVTTGGVGDGGGGGYTATGGGHVYGTHTSTGLMNTNGVTHYKEKKCNRFTNWWKRLFNKQIPKCPKKKEEYTRRLRASDAKP
ncbi:hypothetical protein PC129_g24378 [Phytophthora cactorum]|uniref:RxLR effector protein n=1 Tax=Phytophthora cactorum TaxID=29920 RepID=A0A8T1GSE4_9STRA|nr:hypothetical protein PC129_g24378 [Phytophthora cactorum]